jgi:hypothetical protein
MIATLVWFLWLITFNPYSKQVVAGPFYEYSQCSALQYQSIAPQGSMYSCQSQWIP